MKNIIKIRKTDGQEPKNRSVTNNKTFESVDPISTQDVSDTRYKLRGVSCLFELSVNHMMKRRVRDSHLGQQGRAHDNVVKTVGPTLLYFM
jgi:hypothetical protein